MKKRQSRRSKHSRELKEAAVSLYRDGSTEAEIVQNKARLMRVHRLGSEWEPLLPKTLNRWLNLAKEADPDLEIVHLLNRRRRRPGLYNHWEMTGEMEILTQYHDRVTHKMYVGPGMDYIPIGEEDPPEVVRVGDRFGKWEPPGPLLYLARLASLGYSLRGIEKLWKGEETRHPNLDEKNWEEAQRIISAVRTSPAMSYSTIRRTLQGCSFRPVSNAERRSGKIWVAKISRHHNSTQAGAELSPEVLC
jgi:hypothetical protein